MWLNIDTSSCKRWFLTKENAPTPEVEAAIRADRVSHSKKHIETNIIVFHDESTFQSSDDETRMWGTHVIKPKSRNNGI